MSEIEYIRRLKKIKKNSDIASAKKRAKKYVAIKSFLSQSKGYEHVTPTALSRGAEVALNRGKLPKKRATKAPANPKSKTK